MNYTLVINDILKDISSGKYRVNDKLPSEKAITIKYDVSRIVASRVFLELKKIGAIYSIPKKGNYVAMFFEGLLKPMHFSYGTNNNKDGLMEDYRPDMFDRLKIKDEFNTFTRNYYKDNETIVKSQNWIDKDIVILESKSIIESIKEKYTIVSSITLSKFELFLPDDKTKKLVTYRVIYTTSKAVHISRFTVDEEHFEIIKQEFIL